MPTKDENIRSDERAARAPVGAATQATGIASWPPARLWVAALRGQQAELSALIESAAREAVARGEGFALAITEHVSAVLYNGLGRYDAALAAVREAGERPDEIGSPTWAVAELIEAAVRLEDHALAHRGLERLAGTTQASGTELALGIEARSRALLSAGDAAESLHREAIERLQRTRLRVDLARSHLLYGEWLRRERRRVDARERLRTAFEMFTAMGVEAFTGRAEGEPTSSPRTRPRRWCAPTRPSCRSRPGGRGQGPAATTLPRRHWTPCGPRGDPLARSAPSQLPGFAGVPEG
jgi:hypothetical protein